MFQLASRRYLVSAAALTGLGLAMWGFDLGRPEPKRIPTNQKMPLRQRRDLKI